MKKQLMMLAAFALIGTVQAAKVTILPVDNAKFLAGAKFDFRIELADLKGEVKNLAVTVNGIDASRYFAKSWIKSTADKIENYMIRDVALRTMGEVPVMVSGSDENGAFSSSANFSVVRGGLDALKMGVTKKAKNIILFIGDGMGWNTVGAARIIKNGITNGKLNSFLEMEKAEGVGSMFTSGLDGLVTDSANSASAYATGHKSSNNGLGVYPDNTANTLDDPRQEQITELLRRTRGMSVGIVTTSYLSDATPAAWASHTRRRGDYSDIITQFIDGPVQPDVLLGGGSQDFLPKSVKGSRRKDERDIIKEFQTKGYQFVTTAKELNAANNGKLLGLFQLQWMNGYLDRFQFRNPDVLGSFTDQPTLWDMSMKAIDTLSTNPNGFFLMVEGSNSDVLQHALDWQRATWDAIEMDTAVGKAKAWAAQRGDTLVIVTADHAHSNSTYGTYNTKGQTGTGTQAGVGLYEANGFPTYQKAGVDQYGLPKPQTDIALAVGYAAAPTHYENYLVQEKPFVPTVRQDNKDVANPAYAGGFLNSGNVTGTSGVHTVDPVPVFASGPGAQLFTGIYDNTELFFKMVNALGLDPLREVKK
jgi:alkaline phosphatase